MKNVFFSISVLLVFGTSSILAQKAPLKDVRANLLFGLNQPLLGGFNIEGNYFYNRWAFDYSHGVGLNFSNEILDDENQQQDLDILIPWTTGFGIGYRFNQWLNLRAEPKWHKFELYYKDQPQTNENLIVDHTTFTLGLGLYANLRPFKNKDNFLQGIMIAPSVRWWPQISSSLPGNEYAYYNESTDQMEVHDALEVGLNNSPWIVNLSIGYSLDFNKE